MISEQAALIRNASENLEAAKILTEKQFYGIAISRVYYAMFYVAEAFLLGEGLAFSKHSAVIAAFGKHFAKTGRVPEKFHRYLIDTEKKRVSADYEIKGPDLDKTEVNKFLSYAEQFLRLAEQMIGPLPSEET